MPSQRLFSFFHFCTVSPPLLLCNRSAFGLTALLNQSFTTWNSLLLSSSSPTWFALSSYSVPLSASPPRPPTSVAIKYPSNGFTACSFANKLASHFLSDRLCHLIPSSQSSFLRTFLSFLHFLHFAKRWTTDCSACPHHQHSVVSTTLILS